MLAVVRHVVGAQRDNGSVSEPGEASPHHVVQKPRKRTGNVQVSDFTMMVKVPGRPQAIRVFTAAEDAEAQDRADRAEIRAMCERRLAHMRHREELRHVPETSPLKAFITAYEASE